MSTLTACLHLKSGSYNAHHLMNISNATHGNLGAFGVLEACTHTQVTEALDLAQRLGMTVMRTWAFSDGTAQFKPLQPELGQLRLAVLR